MKKITETYYQDLKIISQYCAIFSFSFGSLIFLLYLLSKDDKLIMFGFYFTFFAIALNTILLTINLFCALFSTKHWKNYLINSGILLINVPFASLYFYIALEIAGF